MDSKHSLFDAWALKGYWWIATNEVADESSVPALAGELSFEMDKGANLHLLGQLQGEVTTEGLLPDADENENALIKNQNFQAIHKSMSRQPTEIDLCLHGRSICGKPITLLTVTENGGSSNSNSPLAVQSTLTPRLVLLNIHATHTTTFSQITVSFPGLDAFLQERAVFSSGSDKDNHRISIPKKAQEWVIDSTYQEKKVRIEFWQRSSYSSDASNTLKIGLMSAISITTQDSQNIDWWLELVYSLQYLMSIMYGFPICPDRFFLDLGDGNGQCSVWYAFDRSSINREITKNDLVVANGAIPWTLISSAFETWLNMPKEYESVAHQFIGNFYTPHKKARVDFVFYSQTLEIFHELLHPSESMLSKVQTGLFNDLKDYMRKNIMSKDKELYDDLNRKLERIGYPSQRTRLCSLFNELEQYISTIFYKDPDPFVTCIVDTRNFYIHGSLPKKDTFFSLFEQTVAVEGLKLAVLLLFLRHLGFPGSKIRRRIFANPTLKTWKGLSPKFLSEEDLIMKTKTKRKKRSKAPKVNTGGRK